jgi:hypothetical protein
MGNWNPLFPAIPGFNGPPIYDIGPANNGTTQQQKQTDCIKAANKKFVSGMQGPGAWDSFKRAQPSVPKTLFTWGASGVRTWSWSGAGLAWSYAVNVLWNGGQQMVDYVKQASAVNSQYDAEIAACKQLP